MEKSSQAVEKSAKKKLRWYQFSLRSLLIFVTLCAFPCSWLAVKMGQAKRQKEAVEAIKKAGGFVSYDYEWPKTQILLPPTWIEKLFGFDFVFNVVGSGLTETRKDPDEAFKEIVPYLANCKRLRFLSLGGIRVTDKSIAVLLQFKTIECLNLDDSAITDEGLARLRELPVLKSLSIVFANNLTDEGIVHLKEFPSLQNVVINNNNPHFTKRAWDITKSFHHDPFENQEQ